MLGIVAPMHRSWMQDDDCEAKRRMNCDGLVNMGEGRKEEKGKGKRREEK